MISLGQQICPFQGSGGIRKLVPFALNILLLLGLAGRCTAASGAIKNVLVIHEGSVQMLIDNVPRHELDGILGANREVTIQLFHEYMDDWTLKPDLRQMAQALRQKYWEQRKPDLIIAVGPSALRLLISYDTEYFDGTPVVFVLNSDHSIAPDSVPSNMTGVSGHFDMAGTIELALRLHPGTRHVFFAGGSSKIEQFYKEIFKQEAGPLLHGIEVTYLDGLPFGEMLSRLEKLPEHSLVYFDILNSRVQGYHLSRGSFAGDHGIQCSGLFVSYAALRLGGGGRQFLHHRAR